MGALVLVVNAGSARAQAAAPEAPPDVPQTPVIEPLPTTALPAPSPPAQTPPPALLPAQPQTIHKPYLGLVLGGRIVFGISYGIAAVIGGIFALTPSPPPNSISDDVVCDSTCKKEGALLLVPVVGPLLSFNLWPHDATATEVSLVWSGIEAAGLATVIVGLIGHDVPLTPLPTESPAPGKVSLVPLVTPAGGTLSMRMAF